jgi:acetyl esterase
MSSMAQSSWAAASSWRPCLRGGAVIGGEICLTEQDILRDQGEAYADKLRDAGVPTTSVRFNGTIHDFMRLNALRDSESTRAAISLATAALRRAFGTE